MTARTPAQMPWHLVIPVKGTALAKSRLTVPAHVDRLALSLAFAMDTIGAVAAALERRPGSRLLIVTGPAEVHEALRAAAAPLPIQIVLDPGNGLNEALIEGVASADPNQRRAILLGDLPALQPDELDSALTELAPLPHAAVPDAAGTGTVLLTAAPGLVLRPSFGDGSAARHEASGHQRCELDLPTLRTDVDDNDDLAAASALGLGPRTAALLRLQ